MITSGSGMERFIQCLGSSVLPRAIDANGTEHTTRGKEVHAYLRRINDGMKPEDALELVEERFRQHCAAVDLDQLRDILGLTGEMTFAYNPLFGSCRVLGQDLEREYVAAGLTEDEVPITPDVIGVDDPVAPRIGIVVDYKDGWSKRTRADQNWQMRGGALALARTYDLDIVRVQLIHLRDGVVAYRDTWTFTAADLAMFEAEVRVRWNAVPGAREAYEQRRVMPELVKGPWCDYCPSYFACPAQMSLVRAAVNRDEIDPLERGPLQREDVAAAWRLLQDIEKPRQRLMRAIYAAAKEQPVLLERQEDGTELWLGITEVKSPTKLDAAKAREVVKEMLGPDAVDEVSKYEVAIGRIEAACKKRVPKGQGAAKLKAVLAELDKRGGVQRPTKHDVDVYKLQPRQLAAKAG